MIHFKAKTNFLLVNKCILLLIKISEERTEGRNKGKRKGGKNK